MFYKLVNIEQNRKMSNFDYLALMRLWLLTISRLMLCKLPLNFEIFFWEKTLNCVNKSLINDKLAVYITSHYYHWFAPVGALIYFTQPVLYPTDHRLYIIEFSSAILFLHQRCARELDQNPPVSLAGEPHRRPDKFSGFRGNFEDFQRFFGFNHNLELDLA